MERQEPGRRDMGREEFLERVWAWKEESGGTIISQLQAARRVLRLVARALHHGRGPVARRARRCSSTSTTQGLIYKDKRLVNWDPKLLTAISDLEVEQIEMKGHLWHFSYPIEGDDRTSSSSSRRRGRRRCWAIRRVAVHPERRALQAL